ncbi:MAG TPA: type IV toxin-antitoxin system AbiEi family antitoxin [Longimicrobium sp.]|nr:type IV toxin-antitoxin system AbiEi family antitoxin [Longimicrobium sp.]
MSPVSRQRGLLARFVDERQARGRYVFRFDELTPLALTPSARYAALQRLERAGRIRKVGGRLGIWLIVPPEYRDVGAPPAAWVLDDVMTSLGVPYYVGLRSAAEWLGATHHAVQTLQVVVGRQLRPFAIGRERLRFFEKRTAAVTPTTLVPGQSAPLRMSTPGATALDLVRFMVASGGINAVSGVLAQIADRCTPDDLRLALDSAQDTPSAQRLGWLLERLEQRRLAGTVAAWLRQRPSRAVPLELGQRANRSAPPAVRPVKDAAWRVVVNCRVDSSL